MVMKHLSFIAGIVAVLSVGACNKPSSEDCKQAIAKMEDLLGTNTAGRNDDNLAEVRRCVGGSSKEAVACAIKANTLEELRACSFMAPRKKSE
jgi:uncharacterized membrane protein